MGVSDLLAKAAGGSGGNPGRGAGYLPDLNPETIMGRMQDPPDKKRKRNLDKLAAQAAAGDAKALERLHVLGALPGYEDQYGKGYGAGTRDGRNYARYLLETQFGEDLNYLAPGDKYAGDDVGDVLKTLGPLAGAAIPGVGFLGAAAIGAGSTAAGDIAKTGSPNLKNALIAGTLSGAGNSLLGNGLGSVNSALPGVPGTTTAATGAAGMGGNATAAGSAAGASGVLGTGVKAKGIGDAIAKYGPAVLGAIGTLDNAGRYDRADRLSQQQLDMLKRDWDSRGPARDQALERVLGAMPTRPDLSPMYQSPNPYARPVPRG